MPDGRAAVVAAFVMATSALAAWTMRRQERRGAVAPGEPVDLREMAQWGHSRLREKAHEPAPAWPLALGRVTVFAMLGQVVIGLPRPAARIEELRHFADMPPELLMPPQGWWWLHIDPFEPTAVTVAAVLAAAACVTAAAGVRVREAGLAAVILSGYVLSATYWYGKVDHAHHLLWLGLLLALSPSADTLAPGRWRARPPRSGRYGRPLKLAWALVAVTYFFPGLLKLSRVGFGWVSSTSMANLVWLHRWNGQATRHPFDPDVYATVLQFGAALIVVFELCFVLLVWSNRWRPWLVAFGVAFHLGTGPLLGIWGWGWLASYPLLLGVHGERKGPEVQGRTAARASTSGTRVGLILVCGAFLAGLMGAEQGWPFAAYPGFATKYQPTGSRLVAVTSDEGEIDARAMIDWMPSHASYWTVRRVAELGSSDRLEALESLTGVDVVSWWIEEVDTRSGTVVTRIRFGVEEGG